MTDPSLVAQTITISHNVAIAAASAFVFAGFMLGYAIGWHQRRSQPAPDACSDYHIGGPLELGQPPAVRDSAEDRVRRSHS
ncbi:hypothetical protein [Bradyrhizobium cosmicum]|uniref:ABC transporter n=1 Tax=Bradyrhizobium cosmicum TaxID=1404864 RepID=A0AAI8MF27_9BRAD|nr:hypothetical protein [Bradyrhizobium cosmicum]BAL77055.1 putative ABC transporter [Bradyrhizobium cosmicum]